MHPREVYAEALVDRAAAVYLRQSTEKQVRHNGESRRLQYALEDRARELGFTQVRAIDSDLGSSADVDLEFDSDGVLSRFNGGQADTLRVSKVPRGNSVGVIEAVRGEVAAGRQSADPSIQVSLSNDSTVQMRDSINVLLSNALFGLGLLVVILFLFVGFRNAVMTALDIPITFAITFVMLEALGETFNSNTLFGLVPVLGLIVDHDIVIVENSFRYRQLGLTKREAAIEETNEVIVPVIAATLTAVAAFLPLTLLPGVEPYPAFGRSDQQWPDRPASGRWSPGFPVPLVSAISLPSPVATAPKVYRRCIGAVDELDPLRVTD